MAKTDVVGDTLNAHYTPTRSYSIGYYGANFRNINVIFNGIGFNRILYRGNFTDSQFNVYFESAFGNSTKYGKQTIGNNATNFGGFNDGKNNLSGFAGFAFDGENRRFYISWESMIWRANGMQMLKHSGRLGIAPYVAEYGGIHSWFMVQVDAIPKTILEQTASTNYIYTVTPLLRFFHDVYLAEVGYNVQKQKPFLSITIRL